MRNLKYTAGIMSVAVVLLVGSNGCAPRTSPGDVSPLFLQETDRVEFLYSEDGIREALFVQMLGVGVGSPEAEDYRFSVEVVDELPPGATLVFPTRSPIELRTMHGKQYSLPWYLDEEGEKTMLTFDLTDVPAVDLTQPGACCACDDECGGACSVEFSYSSTWNTQQGTWGELTFVRSRETIPFGRATAVDVLVSVKTGMLRDVVSTFTIPVRVRGARVALIDAPQELTLQRFDRWIQLTGEVTGEMDSYSLSIAVEPSLPGDLTLRDFIVVRGTLGELVAPSAVVDTDREVTRTTSTEIFHRGDLHITAVQAD